MGVPTLGRIAHLWLAGFPIASSHRRMGQGGGVQAVTPPRGVTDVILSHNLEHEPWVSGFQEPQRLEHVPAGCKELQTSEHLPHLPVDQVVFFLASTEVW